MKIPKIILILVIIALLFVSCDDAIPLAPEDAEFLADTALKSSVLPLLIVFDEPGLDFTDFDGVRGEENNDSFTFTWENFNVLEAAGILEEIEGYDEESPMGIFFNFISNLNNLQITQLLITSGTVVLTDDNGTQRFNADFNLKINTNNPDLPKGTFSAKFEFEADIDGPKDIDIYINNQKVDYDFD